MPLEQIYFPHGNATPWCKILIITIAAVTAVVVIRKIALAQKEKPVAKYRSRTNWSFMDRDEIVEKSNI